MPTVTKLEVQQKNRERLNVYLDGEFAFGLAVNAALGLRTGQALTPQDVAALQAADDFERAYIKALNFLSYRARSEREVADNLRKRRSNGQPGYDEEIIGDVLAKLRRRGYVNDAQFARDWVDNRQQFRPRARRLLAVELAKKGIGRDAIDAALQALDDDEAARAAAQERAGKFASLEKHLFQQKLGQFLGRRGFTWDVIRDVVEDAWVETHRATDNTNDKSET